MIEFSIAFQTDKRLSEYGSLAELVEQQGFDAISVYNDLFFQPAWLPLMEIARHTRQIQLGVAAVNPFTCHPINIAGNIALIDGASNGRAYLGLARGAWLDALDIYPTKPITAIREAITLVRKLVAGDDAGFTGEIFSLVAGQTLRWSLYRDAIPILLGTWGEQLIARTADLIDLVKVGGSANPPMARWTRERIDRHANGRAIGLVVGAVTVVDADRAIAVNLARREVAMYLAVVAALDPTFVIDPDELARVQSAVAIGDHAQAAHAISDATLMRFAFCGTPSDIVNQARDLADAGATRIEFGTPHGVDRANAIRLLGERVVPEFRSL
ncbi:MAG: LLM class flavin-dependent oxidoreductase [Chloroflexi bacterium]|nr:LLM class flavin-dependent oxidoreductase [Chloroflexota bacterium]